VELRVPHNEGKVGGFERDLRETDDHVAAGLLVPVSLLLGWGLRVRQDSERSG
jgi:hypothetical protein